MTVSKTSPKTPSAATRPALSLSVQYAIKGDALPTRPQVRKWVKTAIERDAEITVRFVDEAEGRALNHDYRHKDYATNVLSFVYADAPVTGDLVICVPVVMREAAEQKKSPPAHFAHLVIHGVLHLQGYDHEKTRDAKVMEARETELLTQLGHADPYA
jgi:probable rRNA maturation factor